MSGEQNMCERMAHLVACLERIPCQQMMAVEDCDVAVATHVLHPDRYEKVPRSEWCDRCDALSAARSLLADQDGAACGHEVWRHGVCELCGARVDK